MMLAVFVLSQVSGTMAPAPLPATDTVQPSPPALPIQDVACPALPLGGVIADTELRSWLAPAVRLNFALEDQELAAVGAFPAVLFNDTPLFGGRLFVTTGADGTSVARLGVAPETLPLLASGGTLTLGNASTGLVTRTLLPVDAAPLLECIGRHGAPIGRDTPIIRRHSWTYVPLPANSPVQTREAMQPHRAYPPKALADGREGTVRLHLTVATTGRVSQCKVISSSGHADLDDAACKMAMNGSFLPATDSSGQAIPAAAILPVQFVMAD